MSWSFSLVVSPSEIQLMADASNGMSMGTSFSYNVKTSLQRFFGGLGYNNTAVSTSSLNGTGYNNFLKDMASRKGWPIPNDTKSYKSIEKRLYESFKKPSPAPGMTDVQPVTTSSGLNRYTLEANPNPPARSKVSPTRTASSRAAASSSSSSSSSASSSASATSGADGSSAVPTPPTSVPPTSVPPTSVPPTSVPPTSVPPTSVPPTSVPPTSVPPTSVPPTSVPPTSVPPTSVPPTSVPTPAKKPEVKFSWWNMLLYAGITGSNEAIVDYRSGGDLESGISSFGSGGLQGMGYYVSQNMLLKGIVWGASKTALGSSALSSVAGASTFLGMNPVTIAALVVITSHTIALNYADNKDWDSISSIFAKGLLVANVYVVPSAPALETSLFESVIDPETNKVMTKTTNYPLELKVSADSKFFDKNYSEDYDKNYVWDRGKFVILNEGVLSKTIKGLELYDFIKNEKLPLWERAYRSSMNFFSWNTASHSGDVIQKSAQRVSADLRKDLIHGANYYIFSIGEEGIVQIDGDGVCDVKDSKIYCDLRGHDLNDGYYVVQTRIQYNNLQKLELMTPQKNEMLKGSGCELYPNEKASDWLKEVIRNSCMYNFYDSSEGVYTDKAKEKIEEVKKDLQESINGLNELPSSAKKFILKVQNEEGVNLTNLLNNVSVDNTSLRYSMNALVAGYPINTLLIVGNPPVKLTIESESVYEEVEYSDVSLNKSIIYYIKVLDSKLINESLGKKIVLRTVQNSGAKN